MYCIEREAEDKWYGTGGGQQGCGGGQQRQDRQQGREIRRIGQRQLARSSSIAAAML